MVPEGRAGNAAARGEFEEERNNALLKFRRDIDRRRTLPAQ